MAKTGGKKGRPSKYTQSLADRICERLAQGETLRRICRDDDMPEETTVRRWALKDYNGFYPQYAQARDLGLDAMADELLDIADDGENDYVERERKDGSVYIALDKEAVMRSSLRVDTRKWYLSKLAPKRYDKPQADRVDINEVPEDYSEALKVDEDAPGKPVL